MFIVIIWLSSPSSPTLTSHIFNFLLSKGCALRVKIEGKRFEVATHRHVKPCEWSPSAGKVKGKSDSAMDTNMALDEIKMRVYQIKERILLENRNFSIDSMREKWFGEDRNKRT